MATLNSILEKTSKSNPSIKRIYASVKTDDDKSYYSFYPDKIVKTTDTAKTLNTQQITDH